jgi:hypothetical protein
LEGTGRPLTRDQSFGMFAPLASSLFRALRHVMLAKSQKIMLREMRFPKDTRHVM